MRELRAHAQLGLCLSALALISAPGIALAQEACTTDSDCEHGFSCEAVGGCADVDCPPGADCEAPPPCEPTLGCVPVSDCAEDNDCIEGWKCITREVGSDCAVARPAPACPPDEPDCAPQDVPADEPADCPEPREESACVPPWALPCESADDCGPGFDCQERIAMSCSGGGSAGSGAGSGSGGSDGFAPPPESDPLPPQEIPEEQCTSEPTGEFQCVLIETTCSVDSDCDAGLTCQSFASDATCSGGATPPSNPSDSGGSGDGDPATPDGGADLIAPPECQSPEPVHACAPPSFQVGLDYGRGGVAEDDSGSSTGGTGVPGSDPNGGEEPPTAPVDGEGQSAAESGDGDANADMMSESSGCSALGAHGGSGALLMVLAVLGLAVRRRSPVT